MLTPLAKGENIWNIHIRPVLYKNYPHSSLHLRQWVTGCPRKWILALPKTSCNLPSPGDWGVVRPVPRKWDHPLRLAHELTSNQPPFPHPMSMHKVSLGHGITSRKRREEITKEKRWGLNFEYMKYLPAKYQNLKQQI